MKVFSCSRCGAPLDVPDAATTVRCAFCGAATPTGARLAETAHVAPKLAIDTPVEPHSPWGGHDLERRTQQAANAQAVWILVGVASMVVLGMASAFIFAQVQTPSVLPSSEPAPVDLPPVEPPPITPPPPPVVAPTVITPAMQRPLGMLGVHQRTRWLRSKGCKSMVAPTMVSGPQSLESKFAANGKCITVLASAQNETTTLELTMTAPSGAAVPTPAPAHALELSVCPRERGQYPTEIQASDQGQYAVSVLECGRSVAEQPQ